MPTAATRRQAPAPLPCLTDLLPALAKAQFPPPYTADNIHDVRFARTRDGWVMTVSVLHPGLAPRAYNFRAATLESCIRTAALSAGLMPPPPAIPNKMPKTTKGLALLLVQMGAPERHVQSVKKRAAMPLEAALHDMVLGVLFWLAKNPKTPSAVLTYMYEFFPGDGDILDKLAENPGTPTRILAEMARGIWRHDEPALENLIRRCSK